MVLEVGQANAVQKESQAPRGWGGWQVLGALLLVMWLTSGYFLHDLKPRIMGPDEKRLRTGVADWNAWRASQRDTGDLSNCDLKGMDLMGANFSKTKFHNNWISRKSDLSETILREADFSGARASYCLLMDADLRGATLRDAFMGFSDLTNADLSNSDARNVSFTESDFTRADLRGADFSRAEFYGASLRSAQVAGADFTGADLRSANFGDVKDWEAISSIKCANIYAVQANYEFKRWALENGAVEYNKFSWPKFRDACLAPTDVVVE